MERYAIVRALAANGWHVTLAAKALGISRATIYRKIQLYDIKRVTE